MASSIALTNLVSYNLLPKSLHATRQAILAPRQAILASRLFCTYEKINFWGGPNHQWEHNHLSPVGGPNEHWQHNSGGPVRWPKEHWDHNSWGPVRWPKGHWERNPYGPNPWGPNQHWEQSPYGPNPWGPNQQWERNPYGPNPWGPNQHWERNPYGPNSWGPNQHWEHSPYGPNQHWEHLADSSDSFFPTNTSLGERLKRMDKFMDSPYPHATTYRGILPRCWEARETDDGFYIRMYIHGLAKESVHITGKHNYMTISEVSSNDDRAWRISATIDLPLKFYKSDQIKAEMKNGVLNIVVLKSEKEERDEEFHVNVE